MVPGWALVEGKIASCRDVDSDSTPDSINGLSTFLLLVLAGNFLIMSLENEIPHAGGVEEGGIFFLTMFSFRSPIIMIWYPSYLHWTIFYEDLA